MKNYDFPVWHTQGGGLARHAGGDVYTFVEAPDSSTGLRVSDTVPKEWGLVPANKKACDLMQENLEPTY